MAAFDEKAEKGLKAFFYPPERDVGKWLQWFTTQLEDIEMNGLRRKAGVLLRIDDFADKDNLVNVHWRAVFSRARFPSTRVITVLNNPIADLRFDRDSKTMSPGAPSKFMLVEFDTATDGEVDFYIDADDMKWEKLGPGPFWRC